VECDGAIVATLDGEAAVEGADAILERDEVEAEIVVGLDVDEERIVRVLCLDGHAGRSRAQRLCNHRVRCRLDPGREAPLRQAADIDRDAPVLGKGLDRGRETFVGEHRREDPVREPAELCDRFAQLGVGLVEQRNRLRVRLGCEL
jgi:hypothetical protein